MKPTHRRQAVFPGNNFIWSVDGHGKLLNWGIDIYAAIDGFSRRIIWINVGTASNTQVSVARQYLQAIKARGIRPRIIRSDRGSETAMMADMHYSLEVQYRTQHFHHNQDAHPLPLRVCYLYGKSTTNQRIESWWLRLITAQTGSWVVRHQPHFYIGHRLSPVTNRVIETRPISRIRGLVRWRVPCRQSYLLIHFPTNYSSRD